MKLTLFCAYRYFYFAADKGEVYLKSFGVQPFRSYLPNYEIYICSRNRTSAKYDRILVAYNDQ